MVSLLVIVSIGVSVLVGVKKGFVSMLYAFLSILISLVLTWLLKDIFISAVAKSPLSDFLEMLFAKNCPDEIAHLCSKACIYIIALVGLYFLIRFAIGLFGGVISSLSKLPVINKINTVAGAITGLVIGIIWVAIAVNVCVYIPQLTDYINESAIARMLLI